MKQNNGLVSRNRRYEKSRETIYVKQRGVMKTIAITGGIGSGKSTVSEYIRQSGYTVFSCDEIYKDVIVSPVYIEKIQKLFPEAVHNGKINRKILAELVFHDREKLETLNHVAHPLIMQRLLEQMRTSASAPVFAEVPLLFEGGFQYLFDGVIVVERELEQRIQAVCLRDGLDVSQVNARIAAQSIYPKEKNENVFLLPNNGDLSELKKRVLTVLENIRET